MVFRRIEQSISVSFNWGAWHWLKPIHLSKQIISSAWKFNNKHHFFYFEFLLTCKKFHKFFFCFEISFWIYLCVNYFFISSNFCWHTFFLIFKFVFKQKEQVSKLESNDPYLNQQFPYFCVFFSSVDKRVNKILIKRISFEALMWNACVHCQ